MFHIRAQQKHSDRRLKLSSNLLFLLAKKTVLLVNIGFYGQLQIVQLGLQGLRNR